MFWVDEIVSDILKKDKKTSYLITDGFTPSGHAHVGSLRGPIIHDLIRRGLDGKGVKTKFQLDFEDFDPMDGLPIYVDQSFAKYMGLPLNKVPAPDKRHRSFAEQYGEEFKEILEKLGVKLTTIKTYDLYKEGKFNEAIRIVLNSAQKIRQIYKEVSGSSKGDDWYPFQVACPRCGKIGTTQVTSWDGKQVHFICKKDLVEWAEGCEYEGNISPFDGNGKLPWKVEWPAKWYTIKSDVEGEGKDHFAAGGSRDIAERLCRDVFKIKSPYDIRYEHFLIGGAKMSSSKGLGVTAKDMADFLPENILRFLFIRTRYKRAIDFQPEGEAIPLLYDEFDRISELYSKDTKNDLARAYYYTEIDSGKVQPKYLLRFSKIAYMLQMPRVDIMDYAEREKASEAKSRGAGGDEGATALSDVEKTEIEDRIKIAKKWLEKFAPDSYKFTIADELPAAAKDLTTEQKEFLGKISERFRSKYSWTGEELHHEIHNIRKEMNIDPRVAFSSIYMIFIGKDSGPQAGWLLASLEKEFVIKRLKEL